MVRQVPDLSSTIPSLLLAQVLAIPAFCALGFAFGAFTSRFLIPGIFYAGVIEVGIGNIPTQLNRLSMTHHVRNIATSILNLRSHGLTENDTLPTSVSSLLLASVIFVAIAALLFALREIAGTKPKDA
jgi:ABC-type transport system involved in multi-copper enzyme maturation permease subunit